MKTEADHDFKSIAYIGSEGVFEYENVVMYSYDEDSIVVRLFAAYSVQITGKKNIEEFTQGYFDWLRDKLPEVIVMVGDVMDTGIEAL